MISWWACLLPDFGYAALLLPKHPHHTYQIATSLFAKIPTREKVGYLVLNALRLLIIEVLLDVLGVHHSDDGVQGQPASQAVVYEEGLRDRRWIGQAGGLNQDGVKAVLALEQLVQDTDQVTTDCA